MLLKKLSINNFMVRKRVLQKSSLSPLNLRFATFQGLKDYSYTTKLYGTEVKKGDLNIFKDSILSNRNNYTAERRFNIK
jgi:hypothetical protein